MTQGGLCQRCGARPVPVELIQVPKEWTQRDATGVRWIEWWLCASCAEDARMVADNG